MKKENIARVISLIVVCVMLFVFSVTSFADGIWHKVYENNFDSSSAILISGRKDNFAATVNNGKLNVASDDICEWVANDLSTPTASANIADGITINGMGGRVTDYTYTYNGKTYDYVCGSDVGWLMEEVAGKKAMRLLTYPRYEVATDKLDSTRPLTSNYYKMKIVDTDKFLVNISGTYEFEVDYYIPEGSAARTLRFGNGTTSSLTKGKWTTWKFTSEMSSITGDMWLQMTNLGTAFAPSATVYINRVSIKKAKSEVLHYTANEKTAVINLNIEDKYGDVAVAFDMTLPETTKLSDSVYYNSSTKNSGRFGLADKDGNPIATIQVDTNADGTQKIYAVTASETELAELYSGDILGKALNYRIETDWTAQTFAVAINENGASIANGTEKFGPFAMTNMSTNVRTPARLFSIVHHSENSALLTEIDNVTAEFVEDVDYIRCMQDADALALDIPEDGIVTNSFELPTEGATSGATITWSSSSAAAIVNADGNLCSVVRSAERTPVTLTAVLEIGDVRFVKEFDFTVEKNQKLAYLDAMNIPSADSTMFDVANLSSICSEYDMLFLYNICAGESIENIPESTKQTTMTKGELAEKFMGLFDIESGNNAINTAKEAGLIGNDDNFTNNDEIAKISDLATLVYNCIAYDPQNDETEELPVFKTLLETKKLDGLGYTAVLNLDNVKMLNTFIYGEKKYAADVVAGGKAGVNDLEYGFVSYFGSTLYRPYFTANHWTTDGKNLLCCIRATDKTGKELNLFYVYLYNIETQTFRYITTSNSSSGITVGEDDYLYVIQHKTGQGGGVYAIRKINLFGDPTPITLYDNFGYMWPNCLHVTNDGRYASIECGLYETSPWNQDRPEGTTIVVRINLETGKEEIVYKAFDHSNTVNHMQINPEYENLMFFAHETNTGDGFYYTDILDRSNIYDFDTDTVTKIPQGLVENTDGCMIFFTHESWGADGEHLYITNMGGRAEFTPRNGVIKVDKDGTHRQYYHNPLISGDGSWKLGTGHIGISGDNKWAAIDGNWVYLMSLETNQVFPVCATSFFSMGHPNHPHPVIARHKNIANWGMRKDNVLGISWYDFSDFAQSVQDAGSRYSFGDDVTYVDYTEWRSGAPELLCDIETTTKDGKSALKAESGNNIYIDINENIIDTNNGAVIITLDYFDNSTDPIVVTYTKGVENDNDLCLFENMTKTVSRTNSNSWKTAEVVIESGNFEDIGTFESDLHISGASDVYISAISVENLKDRQPVEISISTFAEEDGKYKISGQLSRLNNTVNSATIYAAAYDENGFFLNAGIGNGDYKTNAVADFEFEITATDADDRISFFVWSDDDGLMPYSETISIGSFTLTAESAANGVRLKWDEVECAESYEVYRDGKRIAVTTDTSFNDKYFTVADQIASDYINEYTTPHNYVVRCGNSVSKSVAACIDESLIKYVTTAQDAVIDFGDTSADTYVAVVTAAVTDTYEKVLFSVKTTVDGELSPVNYADMNDSIVIYSAFMGRPTGKSFLPIKQGVISVYEEFLNTTDNGGYSAYVFKINACFDSSTENNLIFTAQDGATVKSVAFIKENDFIY